MNKRIFSVLLAIMLLLAISANANAAVKSVRSSLSLSFSGSTANCSAVVRESGKQINVTSFGMAVRSSHRGLALAQITQ